MLDSKSLLRSLAVGLLLFVIAGFAAWIAFFRPPRGAALGTLLPAIGGDEPAAKVPKVRLRKIAEGFEQPTDVQFWPGQSRFAVVLQKTGAGRWLDATRGLHGDWFRVEVLTASEEGLLGLAFHPRFASNGRFFINYVASSQGKDVSRVAEWRVTNPTDEPATTHPQPVQILMEVVQPYPNHDAGQLTFGPDGYLYVGWGDGGAGGDPHNHGQDGRTLLGSMLRIDVDAAPASDAGRRYAIPKDNPFLGREEFAPETWAYGLRNPWRYSFDPQGRLIVADVGQNRWEELDIVQAGDNLGWNLREGFECFHADGRGCGRTDLVAPVLAYGRDLGTSITGGFVYLGTSVAALRGQYVFGDFGSGRLFAITLPSDRGKPLAGAAELGRWPLRPSSFGRDAAGELYVADFLGGGLYRLE